ncbi:substrate-binding domain-containing protein [Treponema sp. OMZ 840]|uniref:substrate-binding domain-containing protein n=1 Tax=Treponema sp. OMZ 840 TaxID=244313 RepID=UPI003D92641E
MKRVACFVLVVTLIMNVTFASGNKDSKKGGITIGFAVSTLANDFFMTMQDAGIAKAKKEGFTLITLDAQDSSEIQVNQVEDLINRKVDLIILNPCDSNAIGTAVLQANSAGIPVITITRASNLGKVVQHLDIDNKEAGKLIARQMIEDLNGTGKVAILEGIPGASSTNDREAGFIDTIKGTRIKVVVSLTAHYNRDEGANVTEDILQAHPDIVAIYAHNDEMALGAVRTIDAAGLKGKIKVYGIDAINEAIIAIKNGEIAADVQQQPALQMETAIDSALKYLKGEKVEARVNIPLKLLKKSNL